MSNKTPVVLGGALLIGLFAVHGINKDQNAASSASSAPDYAAVHRALRIAQCMGIVGTEVSASEYARQLDMDATRLGVSVETLQTTRAFYVEQQNPGVTRRCGERYGRR